MKYWLLTTEYPPFFGGGIGTYCAITAKMLLDNGHEVSVFIPDTGTKDITIEKRDNIRIIRFNTSRTNSSSFLGHVTNISCEFAHIVKHFVEKEGQPDCIEAQEYQGIAYYLLQFKHLLYEFCKDIPIIITAHSPSFLYLEFNHVPLYRYPNYWIGEMERFCLQAADRVISPSSYLIGEINKRFEWTNPSISVLPNPYKPQQKIQYERTAESETQIIFFGKLSVQKGTFKLLEYFKGLWDSGFMEKLYLVGGTDIVYYPEARMMGDLVKKKWKKYITEGLLIVEDKIPPEQIPQRVEKARLVIIPSTVDNLPYVVLEMMALGKIVLVSKQGGQAEVVENGINGFIFDHENPETFTEQLKKILLLTNEEKKDISGSAIATIAEKYNPDSIYQQKVKLIEDCIINSKQQRTTFPYIKSAIKNNESANGNGALLSIVVPYYNMGSYIEETMYSLEKSSYPDKEIIIINDGSTDPPSLQKLQQYRNKPGIVVVDIENKGLAHARNFGANMANGEFLAFLDADDKVGEGYYEKSIQVLTAYANVHFVGSWTKYFEGSEKTWPTFTPEPPLILSHNLINSSALVYKRNSFLAGGKNDTGMPFTGLEDYDSVVSMLAGGFHGVVLPETCFFYRVRPDSMIRGINNSRKLILYQYMAVKHAKFYANFAADLFNLLNANGPGIILDNPTLDYHLADKLPFGKKKSQRIISLIKKNRYIKTIAYRLYRLLNK